jgi:hypothetical protein
MKLLSYAIACCSLVVLSCKDEKKTTVVATADTVVPVKEVAKIAATEGTSVNITTADVPDSVKMSFNAKYPKATSVQWVRYTPAPDDELNTSGMEDLYYYVRFDNRGENTVSWYDTSGGWVRTSVRIPGDSGLPDAVNKTLNEQYPGYVIEEINKENDKDMDMYEIKLNKGEAKAKLKILPNGQVFKRKS